MKNSIFHAVKMIKGINLSWTLTSLSEIIKIIKVKIARIHIFHRLIFYPNS